MNTWTHRLRTTPERFWEAMLDPAFNIAMYKALGATHYSSTPVAKDKTGHLRWTTLVRSPLPSALAAILPDVTYTEVDEFVPPFGPYMFRCDTPDVTISGVLRAEPAARGGTVRTIGVSVETRGLIATMLEGRIIENLGETYAKSAEYLNRVL